MNMHKKIGISKMLHKIIKGPLSMDTALNKLNLLLLGSYVKKYSGHNSVIFCPKKIIGVFKL